MNRIEKELIAKGWMDTQINKNMSCASWPEKHVRVSMWDGNKPIYRNGACGYSHYGYEFAEGDGSTVAEAFKNLKRNINEGYCRFFPGSYTNPVEEDYKKWESRKNKVEKVNHMNNLEKYSKQIKKMRRLALGYERMLDFFFGYIYALYHSGKITIKEKNALHKVYSNYDNGNERYQIINGKLLDNSKDPEWRKMFGKG